MGWKANCILINSAADGYLGTFPEHQPDQALEIIRRLNLPYNIPGPLSSLEAGLYPETLVMGCYEHGAVLGLPAVDQYFDQQSSALKQLLQTFPNHKILIISLQSVVNLYAYAYYENQILLRLRMGSADAGIIDEIGQPLKLEQPLYDKSFLKDGERFFKDEATDQVYDDAAYGEEFVFTLASQFLGQKLDIFEIENLVMQRFSKKSWWSRLLGR